MSSQPESGSPTYPSLHRHSYPPTVLMQVVEFPPLQDTNPSAHSSKSLHPEAVATNPTLQIQWYDPIVFSQSALSPQVLGLEHSSTSSHC